MKIEKCQINYRYLTGDLANDEGKMREASDGDLKSDLFGVEKWPSSYIRPCLIRNPFPFTLKWDGHPR